MFELVETPGSYLVLTERCRRIEMLLDELRYYIPLVNIFNMPCL